MLCGSTKIWRIMITDRVVYDPTLVCKHWRQLYCMHAMYVNWVCSVVFCFICICTWGCVAAAAAAAVKVDSSLLRHL
jgi:hypothetical protein